MPHRIGEIYNRFTIISFDEIRNHHAYYKCLCQCGNIKSVRYTHLKDGGTKSCGCYIKEITSQRTITHKDSCDNTRSSEYRSWDSMRERCNNPNAQGYYNYGGRGITVCDRWLEKKTGYSNFLEDMSRKPTLKHSIDRIDNSKNYYKENCKWSTPKEQANNRRNNLNIINIITNEIFSSVADTAISVNMNKHTLWDNLRKNKINNTNFKIII